MKNLELLKTGSKPAPGELIVVQGFVNTLDVESDEDEFDTAKSLKTWLTRHGLLRSNALVSAKDLQDALSFREALRHLLLANNGKTVCPSSLRQLNHLVSRHLLAVSFGKDCVPCLAPTGRGIAKALGQILVLVVQAVGQGTWSRLKACNETSCRWAFYDSSKNHSGRWCSMSACGNRDKARAYRRRRSARERWLSSR